MEESSDSNPGYTASEEDEFRELLLFKVENLRCAIPVKFIDHVIRMAAITTIPKPPPNIAGIINYHGEIIPVFSIRKYFSLPEKKAVPSDYLLIIHYTSMMAIIAEGIEKVIHHLSDVIKPDSVYPGIEGISGLYRCDDGLMVITTPEVLFKASNVFTPE